MKKLSITKKKNDPNKVLRISIAGSGDKQYIAYRGDLKEIKGLMADCYRAIIGMTKELEVSPENEVTHE